MFHLLAAALSGAALTAAACGFLWMRNMRKLAGEIQPPPPTDPTEWDRRGMAYHEAGHAVCSHYLPDREVLVRITISPTDEAFGMIRTVARPHHNETRTSLLSAIAVMLAGRIAEEMFLKETTTSCVHDLASARQLAADMVLTWGMGSRSGLTLPPTELDYGEHLRDRRDADIRELLADAECSAHDILAEHAGEVEKLALLLLAKGTIEQPEIDDFFGVRKTG